MYRSILVPLDGSAFGEHALPLAIKLANGAGATLQVVHVHVPPAPLYSEAVLSYAPALEKSLRDNEQAYLDKVVERIKAASTASALAALLDGPIEEALEDRAKSTQVDLIVMTTHGRGTLARAWLGSVADELVRHLTMPIVVVRPHDGKIDLARDPGPKHILIALDGSTLSEQIVAHALTLGALWGAEYTLLRVIEPAVLGQYDTVLPYGGFDPWLAEQLEARHAAEQAKAKEYLEQIASPLRAKSLKVETCILSHDQPAVAILDEVKARKADLIALATHGRSGLPRLFLGSVADKVVRGASVPVLVARPPANT
jgi:nucleotide-binding universal stress UspA family protein